MKKEKCKFCGRVGELHDVTINYEGATFVKSMCEACAKWCSSGDVIIFLDVEEILKWDADALDPIPPKGGRR